MDFVGPSFVKADIEVTVGEQPIALRNQDFSLEGLSGLPWARFNFKDHFGLRLKTKVTVLGSDRAPKFQADATITREITGETNEMGMKFFLSDKLKDTIVEYMESYGKSPKKYKRKYPRIPSTLATQEFPITITLERKTPNRTFTLECNAGNISPNGVLLINKDPDNLLLRPDDFVSLTINPSDDFPMIVETGGVICRIVDELDYGTDNLIRRMGVKFAKMDSGTKGAFGALLKNILDGYDPADMEDIDED